MAAFPLSVTAGSAADDLIMYSSKALLLGFIRSELGGIKSSISPALLTAMILVERNSHIIFAFMSYSL